MMPRGAARGPRQTDAEPGGVATDPSIKVVVLIDKGTASAAEIVAGALQDRGRAQLIGETSFGKGTVQEWYDLGEVGGVKLTVEKWLTPNKRWIHKIGLTPDDIKYVVVGHLHLDHGGNVGKFPNSTIVVQRD
jgi:carboxyl-terminal processing protease